MDQIKKRIAQYQKTGRGGAFLTDVLATRAYEYALTKTDADGAGDFVADLIPRIAGMLDRYRDTGIPFDHYYNSVICWRLKAQLRRQRTARIKWRSAHIADFWDNRCDEDSREPAPVSGELLELFHRETDGSLRSEPDRKRFLLAMLRLSWNLSQQEIQETARLSGVTVEWLTGAVDRLRLVIAPRLKRVEKLRLRRDRAYAGMRLTQECLATEIDPGVCDHLRARASRYATIWRSATRQMEQIALVPTHRQLATVLGIPRGTVGTSFRWLRLRARESRGAAVAA